MKFVKTASIVVGAIVVLGGGVMIKSKLDYDSDKAKITSLISEFKKAGLPTNGTEVRAVLPDSQNSWSEFGPLFLSKNGNGTGLLFHSGIASTLVRYGTAKDLDIIDKFLDEKGEQLKKLEAALDSKPGFQVPHNYDLGYDVLFPEYSGFKELARVWTLSAYRSGLKHDYATMRKQFDYANRMAQYCYEQPDLIGSLVAVAIQRLMFSAGMRLYEVDPSSWTEVSEYFLSPALNPRFNPTQKVVGEFVGQITSIRYYDSPLMDRRRYAFPLDKAFPLPTTEEIQKSAKVHPGDYMPESPAMRRYMRTRLEAWQPYISFMQPGARAIPIMEYMKAADYMAGMPSSLATIFGSFTFDPSQVYLGIERVTGDRDLVVALLRSIDRKRKTGHYPLSLDEIKVEIRQYSTHDDFEIESDDDHITIQGKTIDRETGKPMMRITYPNGESMANPGAPNMSRGTLDEYRSGKIDWKGQKITR